MPDDQTAEQAGDQPETQKKRRLFSITMTLATSISLLVGIALASVIAVMYESSRTSTLELLRDRADLNALMLEDELDDILDNAEQQTAWLLKRLHYGELDPSKPEALQTELLGSLAAARDVSAVTFLTPDGRQTTAYQSPDGNDSGLQLSPEPVNSTIRLAGENARNHRTPFWLDVSYDEEVGASFFTHVSPWWEGDNYKGAMISSIPLAALSRELDEVASYMEATVFILKGHQSVVAHPKLYDSSLLSPKNPTAPLHKLGDKVLEKFAEAQDLETDAMEGKSNLFIRQVFEGDKVFIVIYRPLAYEDKDWIIGAHYHAESFSQQLNRLTQTLLVAAAILVVAIVVAIVLGRAIARPIKALGTAALSIREFQLDKLPPLPRTSIRELNDQSRAFSAMVGGLKLFEVYVPKKLVRRLLGQHRGQNLPSEEREISMLFTDIAGFTALSEKQKASDIAELLNEHFTLLGQAVEDEGGTIDKYIGDALMAFWNAPDVQQDHAARACRAALKIQQDVLADNQARTARGLDPLGLRLGLHCGPVVVGDIGAPGRINYTVVGDTVNATQRLEALGKDVKKELLGRADNEDGSHSIARSDTLDVLILASAEMKAAAGPGFDWQEVGHLSVKGRQEQLQVYRLLGSRP
ncbi:adenylate/guanylate cyclase domain-containing protein [Rhodovibrionaceae bacterium A322]